MREITLAYILIFTPLCIFAKDYGQVGPIYAINETSLLDFIYSKLQAMNANGDYKRIQKIMQAQLEANVDRPIGTVLPQATAYRERIFDPSVAISNDIRNTDGRIVAKSGTIINPLKHISLTKEFIFINADNTKEVDYATKKLAENSLNKIILTTGSIKDTVLKLNASVYFDQHKNLINKFDIRVTPTVLGQSGDKMLIREIAL